MPNIFHQSVEDILKAATPEQKILWNHIFLRFGERCSVSQMVYIGSFAASDLSVYVARRIFVYYDLELSANTTPGVVVPVWSFFDENNNISFYHSDNNVYWDAIAGAFRSTSNVILSKNGYLSRLTITHAAYIRFIGYRIMY